MLLNPAVRPRDVTPPHSYVEAAVLLAMQVGSSYSGRTATDAEVIRDLSDEATLRHYSVLNPPSWNAPLQMTDLRHGVASPAR